MRCEIKTPAQKRRRLEDRNDLRTRRKETDCKDQAELQPANERVRREAEQVGDDRLGLMTFNPSTILGHAALSQTTTNQQLG